MSKGPNNRRSPGGNLIVALEAGMPFARGADLACDEQAVSCLTSASVFLRIAEVV